jgi:hypothetical protein
MISMAMEETRTSGGNLPKSHYNLRTSGGGDTPQEGATREQLGESSWASELARSFANTGEADAAMAMDHVYIPGIFGAGRTPKGRGSPHTEASSNRGHRRPHGTTDQLHPLTWKTRGPVHRPLSAGMTRTHEKVLRA